MRARKVKAMNDTEFLAFINTTTTRGGRVFNLRTSNVSKQAREALAQEFPALAKAHINATIVEAYKHNGKFHEKLVEVMEAHDITIVEP